jgi:hypothetical protein
VAVFIANHDHKTQDPHEVDFAAVWEHYGLAKFLYPEKRARLKPVVGRISKGWPALLEAPPDIFQLHLACRGSRILSSVCAFRDTDETFVLQHAVSQDQPWHMIDCIQSLTAAMGDDPEARFVSMYFRPENRWPTRFVRTVRDAHPPELTGLKTREYLTCEPGGRIGASQLPAGVEEVGEGANPEVASVALACLGHLWVAASGLGAPQHDMKALGERYSRFGLRRERKVLGAFRDGALAGLALCYASGFPMNFSLLCGRVEILVHPEASDHAGVVRELARAAIREAALRQEAVCTLLIDPEDAQAAVAGGFDTTGKRYSCFLWGRENEEGWPSCATAFERWYARIRHRHARSSQRPVRHLPEHP